MMKDKFAAIIVAAGSGNRFGGAKQFERIGDLAAYQLVARTFASVRDVHRIVLVGRAEDLEELKRGLSELGLNTAWSVVEGGETRQQSVLNGLKELKEGTEQYVLVHDAARVLVGPDVIQRVIDATKQFGSAIPALPVVDTIKRVQDDAVIETIPRQNLFRAQTPQGARLAELFSAYELASENAATDESELLERLGKKPRIVLGSEENFKITFPEDLERARMIVERRK